MLYGYGTRRRSTERIVRAFVKGSKGTYKELSDFHHEGVLPDTDYVTSFGFLRGTSRVFVKARQEGKDYLHIDHAYFLGGHNTAPDPWYRISKNSMNMNTLTKKWPKDRFNFYFAQHTTIKPWNVDQHGYILVLPPTQPTAWYTESQNWLDKTVKQIRLHTDREIIVRHKPPVAFVDNNGYPIAHHNQDINVRTTSLEEDIESCYCVVAFNSGAVVDATAHGKPVFCTEHASSYPISFKLDNIENKVMLLKEPDRINWFSALAYNQFRLSEMRDGTAWNLMKEHGIV